VRPVDGPQQLRLQLRAVLLQVHRDTRLQSHLLVAVGQNDELGTARLGDEFSKLSLGLPNGNRFHGA
jgi:hypothetical protein